MAQKIVKFSPSQILAVRTALGMTQTEFADHVGVGTATVPRWENGTFKPSRHTLPLLRQAAEEAGFEV